MADFDIKMFWLQGEMGGEITYSDIPTPRVGEYFYFSDAESPKGFFKVAEINYFFDENENFEYTWVKLIFDEEKTKEFDDDNEAYS